jgi:hypothetical protein
MERNEKHAENEINTQRKGQEGHKQQYNTNFNLRFHAFHISSLSTCPGGTDTTPTTVTAFRTGPDATFGIEDEVEEVFLVAAAAEKPRFKNPPDAPSLPSPFSSPPS